MIQNMRILAIETSCDETAIAILEHKNKKFEILSSVVSSQVKIHAKWGGVVPMLAKREHLKNLPLVLKKTLSQAKIKNPENEINLVAIVNGPGLEPALWTGINFAKDLSEKWRKPVLPINHLEGHIYSVFLPKNREFSMPNVQFPIIALLVSGGHTQIVLIKDWLKYKILGQTRDDAAGEAFDKVAKMMDLGYPGGPAVSKLASKRKPEIRNSKSETNSKFQILNSKFSLPRPMMHSKDYDFSFSGLKTAVLYKLKEFKKLTPKTKQEICHEFEQAVIDVLISKTIRAAKKHKVKTIILGGGVAANSELRSQFELKIKNEKLKVDFLLPQIKHSGDNAAMIALAAYFRYRKNKNCAISNITQFEKIKANGNLKIT